MFPLALTLRTILNPGFVWLLILSVSASAITILSLFAGLTWAASHFVMIENRWLSAIFSVSLGILTGIGGWFMLPSLIFVVSGLFQERVIRKVEGINYPRAGELRDEKFISSILHGLLFSIKAVFLNIMVIPLYFTGLGFMVSLFLNSYLMGREFFDAVGMCHKDRGEIRELRKRNRGKVYKGGFFLTLMTLIPLVNLFVPIIAVVWMVHLYHSINEIQA